MTRNFASAESTVDLFICLLCSFSQLYEKTFIIFIKNIDLIKQKEQHVHL